MRSLIVGLNLRPSICYNPEDTNDQEREAELLANWTMTAEEKFQELKKEADEWGSILDTRPDAIDILVDKVVSSFDPVLYYRRTYLPTIDYNWDGYPLRFSLFNEEILPLITLPKFLPTFYRKYECYLKWYVEAIDLPQILYSDRWVNEPLDYTLLGRMEYAIHNRQERMSSELTGTKDRYPYFQRKFLEMMGEGIAI